ncbi:hypothetical protein GSU68_13340 [Rathayibacter sp. VKM Ac-2759]|uniref:G5 domain-containing protein n=1 Tax=Rathayibacter sp. VKM Ac-2759 TaxID=2609252 RepID=UPI001315BB3C|nr:G5 domain-containing protein [Rathayibacter sp. VKM Ac-2759]QHC67452.1 hypothetical protein GSU68_13340 [Rathayibacter sp. VKM Ac-2759]
MTRQTPPPLPSARRTQDRRTPLRLGSHRLTRLRLTPLQWIGGGATAFVALIGLLTGGIWSAVIMTGLILLVTALYGVALRRPTWLGLPRRRGASGIAVAAALAALVLGSAAYGATAPAPVAQTEVAASTRTPEVPAAPAAQPTAARTATPTPTPTPTPTVVVTTETVTETVVIPRAARTEDDPNADQGTSTFAAGVDGVLTRTFEVVKHDGAEVSRSQTSEAVTTATIDDVTRVGTRVPPPAPAPEPDTASGCDPHYSGACVPIASDVDCASGSGDGPAYVRGPVTVVGADPYRLDNDGDGIACDS